MAHEIAGPVATEEIRAVALLNECRYSEALPLLRFAKENNELSSQGLLNYAILERTEGNCAKSIELLEGLSDIKLEDKKELNLGISFMLMGEKHKGLQHLMKAKVLSPSDWEISFNLGVALGEVGADVKAIKELVYSLRIKPDHASSYSQIAAILLVKNKRFFGKIILEKGLLLLPGNASLSLMLADIYSKCNKPCKAIQVLSVALEASSGNEDLLEKLASFYVSCNSFLKAKDLLIDSLKRNPGSTRTQGILANIYMLCGEFDEAESLYKAAIKSDRDNVDLRLRYAELSLNKGMAEKAFNELNELLSKGLNDWRIFYLLAETSYMILNSSQMVKYADRCIECSNLELNVYIRLGYFYIKSGKFEKAIQSYGLGHMISPDNTEILYNLAVANRLSGNDKVAADLYEKCISLGSYNEDLVFNLSKLYIEHEIFDDGLALLKKKIINTIAKKSCEQITETEMKIIIMYVETYLSCFAPEGLLDDLVDLSQPILDLIGLLYCTKTYTSSSELLRSRQLFKLGLDRLESLIAQKTHGNLVSAVINSCTNFYLSYHQCNDIELHRRYSNALYCYMASIWGSSYVDWAGNDFPIATDSSIELVDSPSKLRVGFISKNMRDHNGFSWCVGWIRSLIDSNLFDIYSIDIGLESDSVTEYMRSNTLYFQYLCDGTEYSLRLIVDKVRDFRLDLLVFTDIGMNSDSKILSCIKLAKYTATAWGHPVTSGSKFVDFYFSSKAMEPKSYKSHYTESVVLLENTGLVYENPASKVLPLGDLCLDQLNLKINNKSILSCQSEFKYLPKYDWIYPEISRLCVGSVIVFVNSSAKFRLRMKAAYANKGLDIENCVIFLPRLSRETFYKLFYFVKFSIDPPGWSGGNTSFQAFSANCPTITMEGRFMRGRHTYAMLKIMGLDELIVSDQLQFVSLAHELYNNDFKLHRLKECINEKKHLLFNDQEAGESLVRAVLKICNQ